MILINLVINHTIIHLFNKKIMNFDVKQLKLGLQEDLNQKAMKKIIQKIYLIDFLCHLPQITH